MIDLSDSVLYKEKLTEEEKINEREKRMAKYYKSELEDKLKKYKGSEKIIDMHCHTIFSDGELEPLNLLKLAIENNIGTFAITDHDNLGGIKSLHESSEEIIKKSGIKVIDGIELTAKVDKGRMHILGYGINIYDKELNNKITELQNNSIYSMISYLNDLRRTCNISFSTNDIQNIMNKVGNIGRPDIAKLLVKYGYVNSVQEAFDKYLIDMYDRVRALNKGIYYDECISLIKNAGGYAILAHPKSLELSDIELLKTIKQLVSCGLDGIEVYHSSHTKEEMKKYMDIVNKLGLLYSGGSDFHGEHVKPDVYLGSGVNNNLNIKKLTLLNKFN